MRALRSAERFVRLMEEDAGQIIPIDEVDGLIDAITAARWTRPASREAAHALMLRLAILKHRARPSPEAGAVGVASADAKRPA